MVRRLLCEELFYELSLVLAVIFGIALPLFSSKTQTQNFASAMYSQS